MAKTDITTTLNLPANEVEQELWKLVSPNWKAFNESISVLRIIDLWEIKGIKKLCHHTNPDDPPDLSLNFTDDLVKSVGVEVTELVPQSSKIADDLVRKGELPNIALAIIPPTSVELKNKQNIGRVVPLTNRDQIKELSLDALSCTPHYYSVKEVNNGWKKLLRERLESKIPDSKAQWLVINIDPEIMSSWEAAILEAAAYMRFGLPTKIKRVFLHCRINHRDYKSALIEGGKIHCKYSR